ncbi:hypothetical protein BDV33DRAFT_175424 [Aspergillus novoparasiticus]|uniref:Uncharacterized protein n=1 Tax=Aspergillus novoparasiticus TaxID=986946 RepID=A0A5N6ELJ9_9EURO|nr:hypothetical protein BDV33DRAFT_175424 [Aspergillus novoparasiticus]
MQPVGHSWHRTGAWGWLAPTEFFNWLPRSIIFDGNFLIAFFFQYVSLLFPKISIFLFGSLIHYTSQLHCMRSMYLHT